RRFDAVTGEWRTIADHRQERTFFPDEAACPLCPTLDPARPTEVPWSTFEVAVFENRFPSFSGGAGACEVVVYADDHRATLAGLGPGRVGLVVEVWAERLRELGGRPDVDYVMCFENRGREVGVTLDHS